jgi:hypothetical protein
MRQRSQGLFRLFGTLTLDAYDKGRHEITDAHEAHHHWAREAISDPPGVKPIQRGSDSYRLGEAGAYRGPL